MADPSEDPPSRQRVKLMASMARIRLRIPRIGVDAPVVPIQSNEERVLDPPETPVSPDGGARALPLANRKDRRYWSDTPFATEAAVSSTTSGT